MPRGWTLIVLKLGKEDQKRSHDVDSEAAITIKTFIKRIYVAFFSDRT